MADLNHRNHVNPARTRRESNRDCQIARPQNHHAPATVEMSICREQVKRTAAA